ncbi:hypothetical protein QQS21_005355 [Conoideocrella luteorostrata]|uniref:DUF7735 domain-containing protein n=1 Tax=Conoideocrella luteorostrata TaxID=1105319 RepID=A0AAJ0FZ64_9HYPO|nr:hypothetical protein QQS21_005355 [Conoideocrella luteorostrata]
MRSIATLLALQATAALASIFDTILPTTSPTITKDPWPCTTAVLEKYFDPPKPTGELLAALLDYGDKLIDNCTPIGTDIIGKPICAFPPQSQWCAITTAMPKTLMSSYSAYGSSASSWWSRYASEAVDYATYCPGRWYRAMHAMPGGAGWLNDTIAFAGCYAADHPVTVTASVTGSTATATGSTTPQPTQTSK